MHKSWNSGVRDDYNHLMPRITEELIKAANSSAENDTSLNSAKRSFDNAEEARSFFETASSKIHSIDIWNECGTASEYAVFSESGQPAGSIIEEGRFIRIYLTASGKYDWVRVVSIKQSEDETVITVKPTYDPTQDPPDKSVVSHFFSDESTNNFCLMWDGSAVSFYIVGIEEKQNTDKVSGIVETARNVAAANLGYYSGVQKAEWKMFCSKFLEIAG
jgi:hypothetical protein